MTPDRHLGAAHVYPGLRPDLLITETTYASTIRDSKRARERDFLQKITDTVFGGGKVRERRFALKDRRHSAGSYPGVCTRPSARALHSS